METEYIGCAMRGRNSKKPSDRTAGAPTEQRLELNADDVSNTITTVQKDALILQRPRGFNNGGAHSIAPTVTSHCYASNNPVCLNSQIDGKQPSVQDRVYSDGGIATAVTTGFMPSIKTRARLRRLTPRECFRLMDVSEQDIDTIQAAGISNLQQYKLAGNSIVVACMTEIFKKLFEK